MRWLYIIWGVSIASALGGCKFLSSFGRNEETTPASGNAYMGDGMEMIVPPGSTPGVSPTAGGTSAACRDLPPSSDRWCVDQSGEGVGLNYQDADGGWIYVDLTGGNATSCPYTNTTCRNESGLLLGYTYVDGDGATQYVDVTGGGATSCPSASPSPGPSAGASPSATPSAAPTMGASPSIAPTTSTFHSIPSAGPTP